MADVKFVYCPDIPSTGSLIGRDTLNKFDIIVWSTEHKYLYAGEEKWYDFREQPAISEATLAPVRFQGETESVESPFRMTENEFPIPEWMIDEKFISDDTRTHALMTEFPEVFAATGPPTDLIEHTIRTNTNVPIFVAVYRPAARFNPEIEVEIERMLKANTIEECESAWAAPIVLVIKKNGSIRFCVDYRKLNAATITDRYPMPGIDHLLHSAKQSKCMSTLDLQSEY